MVEQRAPAAVNISESMTRKEVTMKKAPALLLALSLALSLCACNAAPSGSPSASPPEDPPPEQGSPLDNMALTDILSTILPELEFVTADTELTEENFKSYLFIDYIPGAAALASDPMIGALPHSVVLLRLPEDADAAATAQSIEANADPRKWICVEAEKTVVKRRDGVVLLVMSDTDIADTIAANFEAL